MNEKPILMCAEMILATLDGRKNQTRRIVKPQSAIEMITFVDSEEPTPAFTGKLCIPGYKAVGLNVYNTPGNSGMVRCPYGRPGDRLWVRETFRTLYDPATCREGALDIDYRADGKERIGDKLGILPWKPSTFMPRWASRLTLEIVSVRVERVAEISEMDAVSEGIGYDPNGNSSYRDQFHALWDSLNAKRGYGWDKNPWVWRIEFKIIQPGTHVTITRKL